MIVYSILDSCAILSMCIGFILITTGIFFALFGRLTGSPYLRWLIGIGSLMVIIGYVLLTFF